MNIREMILPKKTYIKFTFDDTDEENWKVQFEMDNVTSQMVGASIGILMDSLSAAELQVMISIAEKKQAVRVREELQLGASVNP